MSPHFGSRSSTASAVEPPRHVAIIMDGNGRWAKRRGLPRTFGHRAGVNALQRTVEAAPTLGITCLTVFGFSTENWRRPVTEVSELMRLLKSYVQTDLDRLEREGVRVHVIGRRDDLSADVLDVINRAESRTRHNDKFLLQVAFNYGGRTDIVAAARRSIQAVLNGEMTLEELDEQRFDGFLSTADTPAPDLIIRTSGEQRLSNFLLWESAYAELVFQDVLWPDYGLEPLSAAVAEYQARERRYGGTEVGDVLAAG